MKAMLIGNPIDKSISHVTHNEFFNKSGIDCVYEKKAISLDKLSEEIRLLKQERLTFLAVTMPLKELILPFLDETTEEIGSINTILVRNGKWIGYNFDGIGCLNAIERTQRVKNKRVLIIGAGGAAKAAIYEAKKRGAEVFVWNRTYERALKVGAQFGVKVLEKISSSYDIMIQATSLGMLDEKLPIDPKWITSEVTLMEMVSNPMHTPILKIALEKGCNVVFGYEMFAELSLAQFELVFGNQFDKNSFRKIVKNFFIKN